MKIAALQFNMSWENRKQNYTRVDSFASQASDQGCDLLVLPEMFATGFSMNTHMTAEEEDGPTLTFLSALTQEYQMGVLGGLVLKKNGEKAQNVAVTIDRNGKEIARYAKTYLFSFMEENRHHLAGQGPVPFDFEGTPCANYICYDLRFPELFRQTATQCQVVFVIASWPAPRQRHWDILLKARAVENQQFVIGVNRVGPGGGLEFTGGTAIIDPLGNTISDANDKERLIVADIDPQQVSEVRSAMPFLNDRKE